MKVHAKYLAALLVATGSYLYADTYVEKPSGTIQAAWSDGLPSSRNPGHIDINGEWQVNSETDMTRWDVTQTTGTVSSARSNGLIFNWKDAVWRLQGGALTAISHIRVGDSKSSGTLVMSGGNISAGGRFDVACNSQFTMSGGAIVAGDGQNACEMTVGGKSYISGGIGTFSGRMIFRGNGTQVEFTGGSWSCSGPLVFARGVSDSFIRFAAGNGSLSIEGPVVINDGAHIDFVSGSEGHLTFSRYNESMFQELWKAGKLRVDGRNRGNFADHFSVTGTTLTLIR